MNVEMPLAWLLSTIGILAGSIATLAGVMWSFMKSRLEAQDKLIEAQAGTIVKLQEDVARMAKGCGQDGCHWKSR